MGASQVNVTLSFFILESSSKYGSLLANPGRENQKILGGSFCLLKSTEKSTGHINRQKKYNKITLTLG